MRICLTGRFFNYRGTGITRMSTEILKGLLKRGANVQVVSDGASLYAYFYFNFVELPLKLPRKDIDVYHSVTSPMEGIWLPKEKSVVTYCDTIPILYPDRFGSGMGYSKWKNWVGKKISKLGWSAASKAKIITCTSEYTRDELIDLFDIPAEKVRILRMGIREDLEPKEKKDQTFRIGTLGQMDRRKRIDLLIKLSLIHI